MEENRAMSVQDSSGGLGATVLALLSSAGMGAAAKYAYDWITHSSERKASFETTVNERVELVIKGYEAQIKYLQARDERWDKEVRELKAHIFKLESDLGTMRQKIQLYESSGRLDEEPGT